MVPSSCSPRVGKFRPVDTGLMSGPCLERATGQFGVLSLSSVAPRRSPGRILLGRDWPVYRFAAAYEGVGASDDHVVGQAWACDGGLVVDTFFFWRIGA